MIVVVQRVVEANCKIENEIFSKIDKGFLLLVGIEKNDSEADLLKVANKIAKLRIFDDEQGKMNLSIKDINGSILSISQFTLASNLKKGNRPSFDNAKEPKIAKDYYLKFNELLRKEGIDVLAGEFGADMEIGLKNDGPVTFVVNSGVI